MPTLAQIQLKPSASYRTGPSASFLEQRCMLDLWVRDEEDMSIFDLLPNFLEERSFKMEYAARETKNDLRVPGQWMANGIQRDSRRRLLARPR
jgi:hypothetical protein